MVDFSKLSADVNPGFEGALKHQALRARVTCPSGPGDLSPAFERRASPARHPPCYVYRTMNSTRDEVSVPLVANLRREGRYCFGDVKHRSPGGGGFVARFDFALDLGDDVLDVGGRSIRAVQLFQPEQQFLERR
jgi:hypothetical protein